MLSPPRLERERPWFRHWPKHLPKDLTLEPRPLYDLIESSARASPGRACLSYQGRHLTYGEVDQLCSRFASALLSLGLQRGDRVAIFLPNTPQFVISYFGTLKAGGIVVPCSPLYKERELEYQLRDSESRIVVAATDVIEGNDLFGSLGKCRDNLQLRSVIATSVTDYLPGLKKNLAGLAGVKNMKRSNTLSFARLIETSRPLEKSVPVNPEKDVALLQYTGGTTGLSKGAMLSHNNLFSNAAMTAKAFPFSPEDVSLSVLPLFHIYGMTATMNGPLYVGARVVLLPRFVVKDVMQTISKERVTCFCGVPTMYVAITNNPEVSKFNLRSVKICMSGGAPLPVAVRHRFMEITGSRLVEGYGLTEASPVTHCNPLDEGNLVKDGSIGIPFPLTDATIVDLSDPSKTLGVGEVGELAVKGPQVMLGYWQKPKETAEILKNGWLLTGDIATVDDDGYFFIVDRKKDMIDVSGFKVYPKEVEEVLFEHPAVREASIVGVPDQYKGESVRAHVVLKDGYRGKVSEKEIIDYCKEKLARYKAPSKVIFVDDLPKTLVGKVLRRKLREDVMPPQQS